MNPTLVAFVFAVVNSNILSRVQIQLLLFQHWAGRFRAHLARKDGWQGGNHRQLKRSPLVDRAK